MTDFLLNAHDGWQYVTLLAVLVSLGLSFTQLMTPRKLQIYRLTAVAVDIQVALGIVLWLDVSGWSLGFLQGWLHPLAGLAALGVLHAFVSRAKRASAEDGNRVVRTGLIIATLLVVAAIGITEFA